MKIKYFIVVATFFILFAANAHMVSDVLNPVWVPFGRPSPAPLNSLTSANGNLVAVSHTINKLCTLPLKANKLTQWQCNISLKSNFVTITSVGVVINGTDIYAFGTNANGIAQFFKYSNQKWQQIGNNPLATSFYGGTQNFVLYNKRLYFAGTNQLCSVGINDSPLISWVCISNLFPYNIPITQIAMDKNGYLYYAIDRPQIIQSMSVVKQAISSKVTNQLNDLVNEDDDINITVTDNGGNITYTTSNSSRNSNLPSLMFATSASQVGSSINSLANNSYSSILNVGNNLYVMGSKKIINQVTVIPIYFNSIQAKANDSWTQINYPTNDANEVNNFTVIKNQIFILSNNQVYTANLNN